jgi:NAD(P)H-dependent FMN reductase
VNLFDALDALPHYAEDRDTAAVPESVTALRQAVTRADTLILVTPEYNGLLSGVIKNAIDWASRPRAAASLAGKPSAVLSASPSPRGDAGRRCAPE